MQAASRAAYNMGIIQEDTTQALFKAMEQGKLMAEDFLPEFSKELLKAAKRGGALEEAMKSTGAALGRFRTNVWLANTTINESGLDEGVRNLLNTLSDMFMKSTAIWEALGGILGGFVNLLRGPIELLTALGNKFQAASDYAEQFGISSMQLSGALLLLFKRIRMLVIPLVVAAYAMSSLARAMDEGGFENWAKAIGAASLAAFLFRKRLKGIVDLFRGGRNAAAGFWGAASAGSVGGGAAKTGLLSNALMSVAVVSIFGLGITAFTALLVDVFKGGLSQETGAGFQRKQQDLKLGDDKGFKENFRDMIDDFKSIGSFFKDVRSYRESVGKDVFSDTGSTEALDKASKKLGTWVNTYSDYLYAMPAPENIAAPNNTPRNFVVERVDISVENSEGSPTDIADEIYGRFTQSIREASINSPIQEQ